MENLLTPVMKLNRMWGVAVLDDRVEAAEEVAVGPGHLRRVQCVENRLVVLVHQDRDRPTSALVQRPYQVSETGRRGVMVNDDLRFLFQDLQLVHYFLVQVARFPEVATAEAEAQHGMAHRPVPPVVDGEPLEQRLVALEQLLARVQEQALAEAPRARQEIVLALVEQPPDIGGLVDVVAVALPDLAEGLDADGQFASSHGHAHESWSPSIHCRIRGLRPVGGWTRSW